MVTAQDVERFLRAVHRGGVWRGVTPELVLAARAHDEGRWSVGYGVQVRDDGVFGKDGGDPGVAAISRYQPATDTTVVLLANVDWDTIPGLPAVARELIATAVGD